MKANQDKCHFLSSFGITAELSLPDHCVKSVRIRSFSGPYSVQMRENADQKTPNMDTFHVVDCSVENSSSEKLLGVIIERSLNFSEHVTNVYNKASKKFKH